MIREPDTIEIRRQQVPVHIGVPDEERASSQSVWISVKMLPSQGFDNIQDDIHRTVDYHAASIRIRELAQVRPRKLIETLAIEIAEMLLQNFPLCGVHVCIEKRILPDTDCVAVRVERHR